MTQHAEVLIVGGGIAGASAAKELRDRGFAGSILLASRESPEPYERPPVTKGLLRGSSSANGLRIHPAGWWHENDVELRTRSSVLALDLDNRTATLASKDVIKFDQALVATGAMVRRLQVPGANLDAIHYLRAPGNAHALRKDIVSAERVVIVGGSYIACEVAASLGALGKKCTLVMQEQYPLERGFGSGVGRWVGARLEDHDVELRPKSEVGAFEGEARVNQVVAKNGDRFAADAVVVGVGALPDVTLARKSGLELGKTGGVKCDGYLQTSAPGVFAAGDMCEYVSPFDGRRVRIEHHEHAAAQGRTAARNLAGEWVPHEQVPYFWTDFGDWLTLEYVGTSQDWDDEVVNGSFEDERFVVRYLSEGRLVAALACDAPDELAAARVELAAAVTKAGT